MSQETEASKANINTGGGPAVGRDVAAGGDFAGGNIVKPVITIPNPEESSSTISIVAIVALVILGGVLLLSIVAMFFHNSDGSSILASVVATDTLTLTPFSTLPQATDTLVVPTKTPNATPTDIPSPTVELTATPEPESTMIASITSAVEIQDAVEQMEIDFCAEGLVYDSVLARQMILQTMAKSEAKKKFFGSQLTSTTAVDSSNSISQTIREDSAGWVRVFGDTRYYDGEGDDEYCVSFVAYVTEEDRMLSAPEK